MELFKITCVTCRARLSVRDAALVGQIIGCPRCGMMVQVTPPVASPGTAAVPIMAAAAASNAVAPVTPPPAPTPAFEDVPPTAAAVVTTLAPAVTSRDFEEAADVLAPEASAAAAPPAAVSAAVRSWGAYKFPAMIVGGALAGSAIAAAGLSWFADKPPLAAASSEGPPQAAPAMTEAPSAGPPTVEATAPETDPALPAKAPDIGESLLPLEEATPTEQPPEPQPEAQAPPETPKEQPPAAASSDDNAATAIEAEKPNVEPAEQPRLRIDPLDVDPEGLDLTTIFSGRQKDPLAESQLPKPDEPAPSAGAEAPPVAAPAPKRAVRLDERAGMGAPVAVDALLARRLPEVSVKKMPLCRLLDLSVQLSGLPVSVAPDELRMAAVTAAAPASVEIKDATIEQLLSAALEPLRLQPVVEGQHIVLKRKGDDARRTVEYPVADLATTPDAVKRLSDWVTQLAAPETWQVRGGDATLAIDGSTLRVDALVSVQYEVLFVLERYRLTRGLPTHTKYPSNLLVGGSVQQAIAERTSAPALFTFSQFTPMREVLRHWQEELEVAVLVDWRALAEEHVWPQTRVACSAADKTWAEAMDAVLEPLGLGWRAVDRRAIEVTSQSKVESEPVLEFYRIRPESAANGEQIVERIGSLGADRADAGSQAVFFDAESRTLLTRLPPAIHRRIVSEMGDVLEAATAATTSP